MRNDEFSPLFRQQNYHPLGVLGGSHLQAGVLTGVSGECTFTPHAGPHGGDVRE